MSAQRRIDCPAIIDLASRHLRGLDGHIFDVLDVSKPVSPRAAVNLAKVISKLSPLLGNLIEFNTIEILNEQPEFKGHGEWLRQDPGFPDAIFVGSVQPTPGFEIKAWFPMATEITARFKDSQRHLAGNNTSVALLAWLPEHLIYGRPRIVDVCIIPALSVAKARDNHYHNPPEYLVVEPRDTSARTRNLQQTNTAGYVWQGSDAELRSAKRLVASWGKRRRAYESTPAEESQVRELVSRYAYSSDTNYAKIDRIEHPEIESFKARVGQMNFCGLRVSDWVRLLARGTEEDIQGALELHLKIKEEDAEKLLK